MNKRDIALITGTEGTRITLKEQLESYIGNFVNIITYAVDRGIKDKIKADLIIISTDLIYDDALKHIQNSCPIIVARRVINYSEIEKMLYIPSGETILFVNDCEETVSECIEWLKKLGVNNYNYIPFYPGCILNRTVKYAVTPGEKDLVPKKVEKVIDIGPRLIDITTLTEILKELNLFEEKWEEISNIYLSKIINMGKCLSETTREKSEAYDHIQKVINSVNEGILAVNKEGIITVFNENLKFLLGIRKNNIVGRSIKEVIVQKELKEFIEYANKENSIDLEIKGKSLFISLIDIKEDNIKVVIFKNKEDGKEDNEAQRELYNKGYYAKYTFKDIIGYSKEIIQTKNVAERLAATDLTVLIEGESGTGKELFASAIHNASVRRDKPFVAVNFSSISENLVESELFGYEEGSFTGATKGGKIGLFEQAEGGTIFLDEIGDSSQRVQSRLLRVLQEKEIMRVGGNKIIPINVRVIAATNQNLRLLVEQKKFRADLYHRLKVLYLNLPSLRNRKEDILPLIRHFMTTEGKEYIKINEAVAERLISYPFSGNVRELKNTIDYMLAVCNCETIYLSDLPQESFFKESEFIKVSEKNDSFEGRVDFIYILKTLYEINKKGEKGSRLKIVEGVKARGMNLSEQMIRNRLNELEGLGFVEKKKGKSGTIITTSGINKIKNIDY